MASQIKKQGKKSRKTSKRDKQHTEDNIDLTTTENKTALKGDYRRFAIQGIPKRDFDHYVNRTKLHICS